MGICPQKFGPYFWGALHLACLYADDYNALRTFVSTYTEVLPCPACRVHYAQVLSERPFPPEGHNLEYFKWSVDVHNIVNNRINKPWVSYDDAFAEWISGCDGADKYLDIKIRVSTLLILLILMALIIRNIS